MTLCKYHQRLLDRALKLLGDDCYYSFRDGLVLAFTRHFNHHCADCAKETENENGSEFCTWI